MAGTKLQMTSNDKSMTCSTELVAQNGWGELVKAGKFDEKKALLSLEATNREYLSNLPHKNIDDIGSNPTASLATLKMYRGEDKMLATLCALIMRANEMLNVGKAMSDWQVKETAKLIFDEYYFLTVADFKVCFSNGVRGKYGQIFDRIDSNVIFHWLAEHCDERAAHFEMKSRNNSEQFKKVEKALPMPDGFMEKIEAIAAKSKRAIPTKNEISPQKFSTLSAFLQHICKNDEESKSLILSAWEKEFETATIEIDLHGWLIYKSNQLLYMVNTEKVLNWNDVISTISNK